MALALSLAVGKADANATNKGAGLNTRILFGRRPAEPGIDYRSRIQWPWVQWNMILDIYH